MRILTALVLFLPTAALAEDDDASQEDQQDEAEEAADTTPPAGLDKLLSSIPTVETRKSDEQIEAEKKKAFEDAQVTFPDYVTTVQKTVLSNWKPKAKLLEEKPPLRTELVLHIGDDGSIHEVGAVTMSGNKKFDKSVLAAVNSTAAVPAPPESLAAAAAQGVIIVFTARSLR